MTDQIRPGGYVEDFTPRTPRVVTARKLLTRRHRDQRRLFLAEGPQAVREAISAGAMVELFATSTARQRYPDLVRAASDQGARHSPVTDEALRTLAETPHPQGLVAVCHHRDLDLATWLDRAGRPPVLDREPVLVAVLVDVRDPGNAGTILRTADAAGAAAVVFAGQTVDPYNGKCVRASAGSVFHLDLVRAPDPTELMRGLSGAGFRVLAAHLRDAVDLDQVEASGGLDGPTAWLFGSEAHGLPTDLAQRADLVVRVPIHGRAESLNLAAAAAVCLYASARAARIQSF